LNTLPVPVAPANVQDNAELPLSQAFEDALDAARGFALAEKSDATRLAYASDLRHFTAWCTRVGAEPMPASIATVAAYLAQLSADKKRVSTIDRRAAAIAYGHRLSGFAPPTAAEPVKAVLRGIRRRTGVAVERKSPATARAITGMLKRIPLDTLQGKRDRAVLLIGFAAALRRSELVALCLSDLERTSDGVLIHIRRSKTDQEGQGHVVAVPRGSKLRPVEALDDWLAAAGIADGPVFRPVAKGGRVLAEPLTPQSVALIVKRWAKAAKLDACAVRRPLAPRRLRHLGPRGWGRSAQGHGRHPAPGGENPPGLRPARQGFQRSRGEGIPVRRFWVIRHADNENLYLASLTGPGMQRWAHTELEAKQFPTEAMGDRRHEPPARRPRPRGRVHPRRRDDMSFDHPFFDWLFVGLVGASSSGRPARSASSPPCLRLSSHGASSERAAASLTSTAAPCRPSGSRGASRALRRAEQPLRGIISGPARCRAVREAPRQHPVEDAFDPAPVSSYAPQMARELYGDDDGA
jgi:integrase